VRHYHYKLCSNVNRIFTSIYNWHLSVLLFRHSLAKYLYSDYDNYFDLTVTELLSIMMHDNCDLNVLFKSIVRVLILFTVVNSNMQNKTEQNS